ncbi:FAD-dependent oxidoreductase [Dyadobacter sandarakinus]|uniref:FAD-dependent oxidoreductase n=1 Tax=Dyadobacter sandarakinus TaxID=2747268 RepID=A0ABX7I3G6_9BACT|nr:FAD-dependent oxidoreductase [Dyadobacter sandarakinus]QRR00097.1 FAD-dependent oxidoreductase [Dyadobacter sandarakinus]
MNQENRPETDKNLPRRDGRNESLWQQSAGTDLHTTQQPETDTCDVLVVGAGITGLTAALLMQREGKKCIVCDAFQAGYGTTGGTTAHINTFADTTYAEVEQKFSEEASRQFAEAIARSVGTIHNLVTTYSIDCDFEWKDGYVYAEDEQETKELQDLYESALRAGVETEQVADAPAPLPYQAAVRFPKQAQFHPLKYIRGLQKEFLSLGGRVIENTLIDSVEKDGEYLIAKSGEREIKTKAVVYATHIPPGGINVLHMRNAPYRSYVIAATLKEDVYPEGLIYDSQDPYHYFRTHVIDGQKYLISGGHDHKTGHGDPEQSFADLIAYTSKCYPVDQVTTQWSSQYYVPSDGLPYIGHLPGTSDGIYAATGYNGNGMILGTVAAMVMSDLVVKGSSPYEKLFNPARVKPMGAFTEFIKENADVAGRFIADRFGIEEMESVKEIPADSGKLVEFQGQKLAVYRDKTGTVEALNPVCKHAGCIVNWNNSEKTWDCPCHGARYDQKGNVLTGPAREKLDRVAFPDLEAASAQKS